MHYLNLPGAAIVLDPDGRGLALPGDDVYLQHRARVGDDPLWLPAAAVGVVGRSGAARRAGSHAAIEESYGSKREQAEAKARRARELAEEAERKRLQPQSTTLLGRLFGWLSRKKPVEPISVAPEEVAAHGPQPSMWQGMPRTLVDAPPVTPLSTAAAAAAPFADALAKAAAPGHALDDDLELQRSRISFRRGRTVCGQSQPSGREEGRLTSQELHCSSSAGLVYSSAGCVAGRHLLRQARRCRHQARHHRAEERARLQAAALLAALSQRRARHRARRGTARRGSRAGARSPPSSVSTVR